MKRITRIPLAVIIVILALAASIAVYAVFQWAVNVKPERPPQIVVSIKATDQVVDFWKVLIDGVNDAASEFDAKVKVIGPPIEREIDVQIAQLEQAILDKPDAIVLAATDYNQLIPVSKRIVAAGIKLITVDSSINSDDALSFIATDNLAAGRKAGDELAKLFEGDSKVAIMSYIQGTSTQLEREQGVRQRLAEEGRFDVIGTYYSDGLVDKAYTITKQLLTEHPDLKGIVGLNEPSTVGVGFAIKEFGLGGKVKLVGFDSSIDEVKQLEEGIIQATIVQKPYNMGYLSVKAAIEAVNGKRIEKQIDTDSVVITKSNMYTEQNQKLLFPFVGK
ncbi:substrate-binding domain-containing protein [Paenibacillus radicis (ex Gao et al. 2016)]|uniref:LacI family transcriptional regulator n=1 Tax=Paenibacillus radicis (ex Gao et al. 2016) TaxID=1737354 RepID=A0A917GZ16_9BACL|nr:substrate-binding domain-containing protein [Paenibacillus radicis (ex Gao et al. 2016)]GGG62226.1 LacI family transcriptional regulator [Paenibacillus radicis (ex Gao et al. 2016)]